MADKISCLDIEIAVMKYFGIRKHLIVPNISWGMFIHECDLFIMTKANYGYEIEIKTNRADLKKDQSKRHNHNSYRIKRLYFAIPDYLKKDIDLIPKRAGILVVDRYKYVFKDDWYWGCIKIREAEINGKYKFTDEERLKLAELGTMRILGLKETIRNHSMQLKLEI